MFVKKRFEFICHKLHHNFEYLLVENIIYYFDVCVFKSLLYCLEPSEFKLVISIFWSEITLTLYLTGWRRDWRRRAQRSSLVHHQTTVSKFQRLWRFFFLSLAIVLIALHISFVINVGNVSSYAPLPTVLSSQKIKIAILSSTNIIDRWR